MPSKQAMASWYGTPHDTSSSTCRAPSRFVTCDRYARPLHARHQRAGQATGGADEAHQLLLLQLIPYPRPLRLNIS
jgi:hypothetical protein